MDLKAFPQTMSLQAPPPSSRFANEHQILTQGSSTQQWRLKLDFRVSGSLEANKEANPKK